MYGGQLRLKMHTQLISTSLDVKNSCAAQRPMNGNRAACIQRGRRRQRSSAAVAGLLLMLLATCCWVSAASGDGEPASTSLNGEDGEQGEGEGEGGMASESGDGSASDVNAGADDGGAQDDDAQNRPQADDDDVVYSHSGCVCESECGNLLGFSYEWCYTSVILTTEEVCGIKGAAGAWDYCTDPDDDGPTIITSLSTSFEVWAHITTATVAGCGVAYFVAGCAASRVLKRWSFLWLPLLFTLVGGVFAFCVGSISAYFVAGVYFSIPYFIDRDVRRGLRARESRCCATHLARRCVSRVYRLPLAWVSRRLHY